MTRRWTALAVLLATACLAMPASASCPGCCAPGAGTSTFVCAVAPACGGCDPLVRPAQPTGRSAFPDSFVGAAAAQSSSLLPRVAPFGAAALRRRAWDTQQAPFAAISPLRL